MKFKCDNCGYWFKSNSETICPECLTARYEENEAEEKAPESLNLHEAPNPYFQGTEITDSDESSPTDCRRKLPAAIFVLIFVIATVTVLALVIKFVSSENDTKTSVRNLKYGESIIVNDLEISFSNLRELSECPELYTTAAKTGMKIMAVDVRLKNPDTNNGAAYEDFSSYKTMLQDKTLAEDGDNEFDYSWIPIGFNGLFENQLPDGINVYRGTEFEYVAYYLVPVQCENPSLVYTDYSFAEGELTEIQYIFS